MWNTYSCHDPDRNGKAYRYDRHVELAFPATVGSPEDGDDEIEVDVDLSEEALPGGEVWV